MPFGVPKETGTVPAAPPAAGRLFHCSEQARQTHGRAGSHQHSGKHAGMLACHRDCMTIRKHSARKSCRPTYALTCWPLVLLACLSAVMSPRLHTGETASHLAGRRAFQSGGMLAFLLTSPLACTPAGGTDTHNACQPAGKWCRVRFMIIVVANSKGGVGKSTLAVHLSAWLHEQGHTVTLADCDTQQSSSTRERCWLSEDGSDMPALILPRSMILQQAGSP